MNCICEDEYILQLVFSIFITPFYLFFFIFVYALGTYKWLYEDLCINHLLLNSKLSPNLVSYNSNKYLTFHSFWGQKFRSSLAGWFLTEVSVRYGSGHNYVKPSWGCRSPFQGDSPVPGKPEPIAVGRPVFPSAASLQRLAVKTYFML